MNSNTKSLQTELLNTITNMDMVLSKIESQYANRQLDDRQVMIASTPLIQCMRDQINNITTYMIESLDKDRRANMVRNQMVMHHMVFSQHDVTSDEDLSGKRCSVHSSGEDLRSKRGSAHSRGHNQTSTDDVTSKETKQTF